jgi:hypothetical protein
LLSGTNETREDELAFRFVRDLPNIIARLGFVNKIDWTIFEKEFGPSTPVMRKFASIFLTHDTIGTPIPMLYPRHKEIIASQLVSPERRNLVIRARAALFRASTLMTSTVVIAPTFRGNLIALFFCLPSTHFVHF